MSKAPAGLESWRKVNRRKVFRIYEYVRFILQNAILELDINLKLKFVISFACRKRTPISAES
jgi:hypothetical protein